MGASKYTSIQIARAFAATMVVVGHAGAIVPKILGHDVKTPDYLNFGYAGVDLFFVISGFIISLVADRADCAPGPFLWKRVARILPFYWLFTVAWLIVQLLGHKTPPSPTLLAGSLAVLPMRTLPYLGPGWSLDHEFIFYIIVFVLLYARRLNWLPVVLTSLFSIGLFLQLSRPDQWDFHLFSLYHLEFLTGVLIYKGRRFLETNAWICALPVGIVTFLLASWFTRTFYPDGHVSTAAVGIGGIARAVSFSVASGLIICGAIALEARKEGVLSALPARIAVRVGDASFALYLLHPTVIAVMGEMVLRARVPAIWAWPAVAVTTIVAILAACVFYVACERPYLALLGRAALLKKRTQQEGASPTRAAA